ncbi:MAG: universal stress protein [Haloplanus sp.]
MPDHVLVPFDGSDLSVRALDHALSSFPDAAVTVLYVVDPIDLVYEAEAGGTGVAEEWFAAAREGADDVLDRAQARADEDDVTLSREVIVGAAGREIVRYTEDHDVDHVVLGSHGREGLSRVLLGSVAEYVVRRAAAPVTVVR